MIRDILKKYYIFITIILVIIVIFEFFIIIQDKKAEKNYNNFVRYKVLEYGRDALANTARIQRWFEAAKVENQILNKDLEQIRFWYYEMFNYSDDIRLIYYIYNDRNNKDSNSYPIDDPHYFNLISSEINDILNKEYDEGKNINDYTNISNYKVQFDVIMRFNFSLMDIMVQHNALIKNSEGEYWPNEEVHNNNLEEEFNIYWNIFMEFFKELRS